MGHCWAKKACDYAKEQIGSSCGKSSTYAKEMDAINFYNTKKNGYANSCSLFVDNCVLHACTDPSYDEDPEGAKWTALTVLYEPQSAGANEGAGCAQAVRYFQEHGAWINDPADMERGDKIFYRDDEYVSSKNPLGVYHTGIIVDWGEFDEGEGFIVVEGNTDGGIVNDHFVSFSDPKIAGAGRIDYDGWSDDSDDSDDSSDDHDDDVEPAPVPDPDTPAEGTDYTVSVNSWLNVRNGPGTDFPVVDKLYDGETVTVYEEDGGWGLISTDMDLWVAMAYLRRTY